MWSTAPSPSYSCEQTSQGLRVETCPISGTIARGENALQDAQRIKEILANPKEESELTMCTDVDRNDKSRICVPGSVKVRLGKVCEGVCPCPLDQPPTEEGIIKHNNTPLFATDLKGARPTSD